MAYKIFELHAHHIFDIPLEKAVEIFRAECERARVDFPNTNGKRRVSITLANTLSYKVFDEFSAYSYKPAVCLYAVKY